ncbi:MAG: hypothetical protein JHD16_18940 [Solirubrobacteraceae bacterium]|nr:hypothetical protein [Solirubrobacteraceae bacterium]
MLLDRLDPRNLGLLGLPDLRKAQDSLAALRDPNRSGDSYGFLSITPIREGRAPALRKKLAAIDAAGSPFARLPRTHFARWVVLPDFYDPDLDYQPADEDRLGCEYLIFSACFDGERDSYLRELSTELAAEAVQVWGECRGVDPSSPDDLVRYLKANQIDCGQYYSAYGHTTVQEVRRVLAQQLVMRDLAVQQYTLTPAQLQAEFVARIVNAEVPA